MTWWSKIQNKIKEHIAKRELERLRVLEAQVSFLRVEEKRLKEVSRDLQSQVDDLQKRLYSPSQEVALRTLMRSSLHLVNPKAIDMYDPNAGEDEQLHFLGDARKIADSVVFQSVIEVLMNSQKDNTIQEFQDQTMLDFGRGIIQGMVIIQDQFSEFRSKHIQLSQSKEGFDPHETI